MSSARITACSILEKFGVGFTAGRVRELAKAITEHGDNIRIELVKQGGNMRSLPGNAVRLGKIRNGNLEIWTYWD